MAFGPEEHRERDDGRKHAAGELQISVHGWDYKFRCCNDARVTMEVDFSRGVMRV
jgi:hypothetical protein